MEAWKYSFETTSIHELKRHSQLLSNIISFPGYRVQKHFHRSPVDGMAGSGAHKKLRAQFYRISRSASYPRESIYIACATFERNFPLHTSTKKSGKLSQLYICRPGVFANLESPARPAELDIGCATNANLRRPVYFCAAACLSGVRFLCTQPRHTHAKHTQLSATLLRGRHKLIMSVDVPSRLYFAVECVNKDLLKALRNPTAAAYLWNIKRPREKTKLERNTFRSSQNFYSRVESLPYHICK
jgi:hypothetical protein